MVSPFIPFFSSTPLLQFLFQSFEFSIEGRNDAHGLPYSQHLLKIASWLFCAGD